MKRVEQEVPEATTELQDRRLTLLALRDRMIAENFFADEGMPIGNRCVELRIKSFDLQNYRPFLNLLLPGNHRR